jgi:membrane protein implicated in regulation of membrane protease activity
MHHRVDSLLLSLSLSLSLALALALALALLVLFRRWRWYDPRRPPHPVRQHHIDRRKLVRCVVVPRDQLHRRALPLVVLVASD